MTADDDVTLTVWSWRPEDENAYNAIFDVYEEANPGVTVEFVPFVNTDYNNILSTGLTGDGGPDVVQLRAYGGLQPLIEAGQLVPLDGEIDLTNFTDNALKAATGLSDGRVYGAPFAYQAFTAFYNKGIFDELGLTEPETWDEFVAMLDTLKENDIIPISTPGKDVWMMPIVMDAIGAPRYGGQEFEAEILSGATDFNDPDYVAAIELMQWLNDEEYIPEDVIGVSYDDSRTLFLTELAGIFIGGSFEIGFWRDNGPDLDLGVFQVPAPPDSLAPASVVGWMDGSYGVNANSDNPDAKPRRSWSGWARRSSASSSPRTSSSSRRSRARRPRIRCWPSSASSSTTLRSRTCTSSTSATSSQTATRCCVTASPPCGWARLRRKRSLPTCRSVSNSGSPRGSSE